MNNDANYFKKTVIAVVLIILMIGGYFAYQIFMKVDEVQRNNIKMDYYYAEYENLDTLSFLDDKEKIELKNLIQLYLTKDLDFIDSDYNTVTIQTTLYKNDNKIYIYFLLDDMWQSLYGTYYDKDKEMFGEEFEWYGDKNTEDYLNKNTPYTYLRITDEDAYEEKMYNKKIAEEAPDEDFGDEY